MQAKVDTLQQEATQAHEQQAETEAKLTQSQTALAEKETERTALIKEKALLQSSA